MRSVKTALTVPTPTTVSVFKHFFKVQYKLLDNGIHSCGKGMGSGFLLPSFLRVVPVGPC